MIRTLGTAALIALILPYFIVVGADLFGQTVLASMAFSEPPRSLAMYQGDYAYQSASFWKINTTLIGVLFIAAAALNWSTRRRWLILISLVGFIIINAVSFGYIFPMYGELVSSTYSDTVDPELQQRGAAWLLIAKVRWVAFTGLGVLLLVALTRASQRK